MLVEKNEGGSVNAGAVVGIVIGGLVLVAAVVVGAWFYYKKKQVLFFIYCNCIFLTPPYSPQEGTIPFFKNNLKIKESAIHFLSENPT